MRGPSSSWDRWQDNSSWQQQGWKGPWTQDVSAATSVPEVICVNLPKASKLAQDGFEKEGYAFVFEKFQPVFGQAQAILSELTDGSSNVTFQDDPELEKFPEISEACCRAGADQSSLCLATCAGGLWAVGLANGNKQRQTAAKLALAVALLSKRDDSMTKMLAKKYRDFGEVCRRACLLDSVETVSHQVAISKPIFELQLGPSSKLVQEEKLPTDGYAVNFEDVAQDVYDAADAILTSILGNVSSDVAFEHSNWDVLPEIGTAIQKAGGPETRYVLASCKSKGKWGVGLATGWWNREAAAKLALCIPLVVSANLYETFADKYPPFRSYCESHSSVVQTKAWFLSPKIVPAAPSTTVPAVEGKKDPPLSPGDICKHFSNGYCSWGQKCRFAHSKDGVVQAPMRSSPATPSAPSRPPAKSAGTATATGSAETGGAHSSESAGTGEEENSGGEDKDSKWVWRRPAARLWAHIFLHKRHADFDLVPMLIGRGGRNMRDIYTATQAKLRIRGRGSGHLEVDGKKEAPVPLMVAVTANKMDADGFRKAVDMTVDRLIEVSEHYKQFCHQRGLPAPTSKEPLFSFGEISRGSEALLKDLITAWPHPGGPKYVKKVTPGGVAPEGTAESGAGQDEDVEDSEPEVQRPSAGESRRKPRTRSKHGKVVAEAAAQHLPPHHMLAATMRQAHAHSQMAWAQAAQAYSQASGSDAFPRSLEEWAMYSEAHREGQPAWPTGYPQPWNMVPNYPGFGPHDWGYGGFEPPRKQHAAAQMRQMQLRGDEWRPDSLWHPGAPSQVEPSRGRCSPLVAPAASPWPPISGFQSPDSIWAPVPGASSAPGTFFQSQPSTRNHNFRRSDHGEEDEADLGHFMEAAISDFLKGNDEAIA